MGISLFMIGAFLFSSIIGKERTEEYKGLGNNQQEIIKGGEKATQLQIRVGDIVFYGGSPLCSTIVIQAWKSFDEMTITWNNAPLPPGGILAEYNTQCVYPGWYSWSSTALQNYVDSIIANHPGGDTIPFFVQIKDRHGGVCDLVWDLQTKESGNAPKLIHNSNTYLSIGDTWIADGPPYSPNDNFGSDPKMLVCSCTLTTNSCTQLAMVEFYIQPTGIEEDTRKSGFILESNPNPFSAFTRISYAVPNNEENVTLRVYNIMGELVKTLVDEIQPIGNYEVMWEGKDDGGRKLLSGYYFYRLTMRNKTLTTKALLLRL